MPNHSPLAIANEFLRRRGSNGWPAQMQIQKLTYIAHGWNLAINRKPLVAEPPEAWDNGPVFRDIWNHVRDYGYRGPNCTFVDPFTKAEIREEIDPEEKAVIDHVWKKYGGYTGAKLSQLTHEPGTPWYKVYIEGDGRDAPLSNEEIQKHYIDLALAGRGGQ